MNWFIILIVIAFILFVLKKNGKDKINRIEDRRQR